MADKETALITGAKVVDIRIEPDGRTVTVTVDGRAALIVDGIEEKIEIVDFKTSLHHQIRHDLGE